MRDYIHFNPGEEVRLYKCIIPKGTRYLYGSVESDECSGYVSHKLIIVEKVQPRSE